MENKIDKIKSILIDIIKDKSKVSPFGFGEEEGNEAFPRWCVYIDESNKLHISGFEIEKSLSNEENLLKLPLRILASLAEDGISGHTLFEKINKTYFKNSMLYEAIQDAKIWEDEQKKEPISSKVNKHYVLK